jgi:UDP-N-acetylmuramoylalanine--D-glutamate ligase
VSNRKVILGAGESGVGAALLAKAKGFETFVSDKGAIADAYKTMLLEKHIDFEEGKHTGELILNADEVIKSPGIPDQTDLVIELLKKGIPVISEIEFASRYTKAKIIAITGTNGKTTTTLLTYHLLKKAGMNVGLAGNIGTSLAKQVIEDRHEYYVLEISSFQLDGNFQFKADIGILLNITPDHLDRYGFNFENYINSKFRITRNMTPEDHFIFYDDPEILRPEVEKRNIQANLLKISLTGDIENGAFLKNEKLVFKNIHENANALEIPVSEIIIKGKHNLINAMAAVLAARICGVPDHVIREGLHDFKNAPHRLEPVATINGIQFINDSKATNVDSVYYALESFAEKLVWIAGGIDKGNDYRLIKDLAVHKVKALVCLGKDNSKIQGAFKNIISEIKSTDNIKDAVKQAYKAAEPGDVVLLSPACASFDLFNNYEDRGRQFKEAVRGLMDNKLITH